MEIKGAPGGLLIQVLSMSVLLAGCGTVKEKTAPCKRPAELTLYAFDPRHECGPMGRVNDPSAALETIAVE